MFINPQTAYDEGWVTGLNNPANQLQPNGLDFTLDTLHSINTNNSCVISETNKEMRGTMFYEPIKQRSSGQMFWTLLPNQIYDGTSKVYVKIPDGVAAILVTRSSFSRNAIFITSGLYDSGYEGHIGFAIYNNGGKAIIFQGTRIGQIIFVESSNSGTYAGGWNHDKGTHYTEK